MINKKLLLFLMLSIFLISIISAQVSYCCEKTKIESDGSGGAWCQDTEDECDTGNNCGEDFEGNPLQCRMVPTSCESTSYCRLGVCINSKEGTCMPNTPQRVCSDSGGVWDEREKDDIPQCQLGCCLIGEQAAFVTLTRCKSLASYYGLEINYRTDIQNEVECITSARPKVKGACVFEHEFERTCKLLTKTECQEMQAGDSSVEFHENYLCSATNLSTNCAATTKTTCVDGRDEVYFLDSCDNLANVYDANKEESYDDNYWTYIAGTRAGVEVCSPASDTCGNCDYFLGTTCKADGGKHVCKDLKCEDEDFKTKYKRDPKHGETWCSDNRDEENAKVNKPGGRYFRFVCYNGEVSVEPCADFRQEVCIQSTVNDFNSAACRVNMWQDCYSQDNEDDCGNGDKRDCKWIEGSIATTENVEIVNDSYSCVPKYVPGFNFWEEEGDAESMCALASQQCFVEYEAKGFEGLFEPNATRVIVGDWKCMEKCRGECILDTPLHICDNDCKKECKDTACVDNKGKIKQSWKDEQNTLCRSVGDCGESNNFIGQPGYYNAEEDLITRTWQEEEESGGLLGGLLG